MTALNPKVDHYLADGCGRCPYYATPQCKVHTWQKELVILRSVVLDTGLSEELKWSMPVYTLEGKNIVMVSAFRDFCSVNFFKGSLLSDPHGLLVKPGENSQAGRYIKFTSVSQVEASYNIIVEYVREAIELEKSGARVEFKKDPEPLPEELLLKFNDDPVFESAFYALTPGRRRGYILHFSQPKQSATRSSRIEKCMDRIFSGKGMQDY